MIAKSNSAYNLDLDRQHRYTHVLLFRHGQKAEESYFREYELALSENGALEVQDVVSALVEHLASREEFTVKSVVHSEYAQVWETVGHLRNGMQMEGLWPDEDDVRPNPALNPDVFWGAPRMAPDDVAWLARGPRPWPQRGCALLVVGHEPQLAAIARRLLRCGRPRRHVTPHGAVSCIKVGALPWRRPQVLWVIEPTDEKTAEQLRKKIQSKMDVAKVFGGVVTLAVGFVLNLLADAKKVTPLPHPLGAYFAAAALAAALVLYVATMYAYDSLLMPARFWAPKVKKRRRLTSVVQRPPSSSNLVLQQNMVNIWRGRFTAANLLVILGFGLLAWGTLKVAPWWVLGSVAAAGILAFFSSRVRQGTQD